MKKVLVYLILVLLLAGCAPSAQAATPTPEVRMPMQLTSGAFSAGQAIPAKYSCRGSNVSPALAWSNAPESAMSFALIVDDPDAPSGTWVHWVAFNIPASVANLPEAVAMGAQFAGGALQGRNSSNHTGYDGPCPPSGTHRYFFKLYALDAALDLASGASKSQLLQAMEGHILAQSELMGTFSK